MLLHSVCLARHVRMLPRHDHCNNRETHHTGKAKFRQALAESKAHMLCLSIEMVQCVYVCGIVMMIVLKRMVISDHTISVLQ